MFQLNLPRKLVSFAQVWISVLLVILAMIFSLMPLVSLNTNTAGVGTDLRNFIEDDMGLDMGTYSIPDQIDVSFSDFIGLISLTIDAINAANGDSDSVDALDEHFETTEGKEEVVIVASLAMITMNSVEDFDDMGDNPVGTIFSVTVSMMSLLYVIVMAFVIPIMLIIATIVVLIKALKNIKTPENISGDLANKLTPMISMTLTVMLFQCAIQDGLMERAYGLTTIFVLAIVSAAINFVATRLREYPSAQFRYINVVQPVAVLSIIGFLVFFFNLLDTGIVTTFVTYFLPSAAIKDEIAPMIIIGVYAILALASASYLDKATRRLTCSVKPEGPKGLIGLFIKGRIRDNNIVHAVMNLIVYILPVVVMSMDYLELTSDGESALTGVLIGAIIMLIAEIAAIVLKNVFCKNLSEEEAEQVLVGTAKTSSERLDDAKRIIAENEAFLASQNNNTEF